MKQTLLTIFLILLIAVFASAGIQLSDNVTRKGTGFNIITHLSNVGDTVSDVSCDTNNNGKIDDVDTIGAQISAALGNRTTDTEFGKITDDSTHWNTAYGWGDWSVVMGQITDDTTHFKTAYDSSQILSTHYQPLEATLTDIADGTIAENLVNTTNPWADNEIASSTNWNNAKDSVAAWDNGDIFKKNVQSFSATIILPKNVSDSVTAIPIFAVETGWAPNGIYVHTVGIKTDNSSTYSVIFKEYSAPNTATNAIDTIATSTSYEAEGTPSDTAIAAGSIIYAIIPTTTGTKTLQVWGTWYKQ